MRYSRAWCSTPADSSSGGLARAFIKAWCKAGTKWLSCGITDSEASPGEDKGRRSVVRRIRATVSKWWHFIRSKCVKENISKCKNLKKQTETFTWTCSSLTHWIWPHLWTLGRQTAPEDPFSSSPLALKTPKYGGRIWKTMFSKDGLQIQTLCTISPAVGAIWTLDIRKRNPLSLSLVTRTCTENTRVCNFYIFRWSCYYYLLFWLTIQSRTPTRTEIAIKIMQKHN